ncbi:MAG: AAA family ATPase [Desulfobacteraceae bacterium]|nr:AAA family ATPase [Desulfobacteraceae bacterium]MBC2720068.1 AAA family ATPase [Desulfobacteraceae bacterium]
MYTKYYGLTSKPFENNPDPLFFFMSNKHREVLASLTYGINSAKGFILIAGDIGTGKTTLIHVLLKEINPDFIIINIINPIAAFNDMLYHLAKKIGVSCKGKNKIDLVEDISNKLEKLDQDGKRAVLIIDEAHLIPDESLEDIRLLSNIESEKRKLIQIVLVGQNELYNKLQKEALRPLKQRLLINRHLEPLDKKETRDYIKHRLNVAGRRSQLFDQNALSRIWEKSRGIPRVINQICDNAMLIGYALEADTIGPKIIKEVIKDMEPWHRHKKPEIKIYISRFKWLGATVSAALLVILLTRYAGNKTYYQQELEPVKKSFSSNKNDSTMPLQSVLNKIKV